MKSLRRSLTTRIAALLLCAAVLSGAAAGETFAASNVITGKDGWYFTTFDSSTADYRGTNLYTPAELQILLQNFINMRDTLAAKGIQFVVLLAPNKEHIYSEYMPDSSGEIAPYTRIEQVYDLLRGAGIRVVYPEEMFLEAKERYPYDLYYKTDSHWNNIGSYLCAKLLMEELGYEMPELEDISIAPYETDDMDCAELLGKSLPDTGYELSGYGTDEIIPERLFFCGDSFGMGLSNCLSPIVDDSFIIHRDIYEPYMLDIERPTVVIYEILERFMDSMPEFFLRTLS